MRLCARGTPRQVLTELRPKHELVVVEEAAEAWETVEPFGPWEPEGNQVLVAFLEASARPNRQAPQVDGDLPHAQRGEEVFHLGLQSSLAYMALVRTKRSSNRVT